MPAATKRGREEPQNSLKHSLTEKLSYYRRVISYMIHVIGKGRCCITDQGGNILIAALTGCCGHHCHLLYVLLNYENEFLQRGIIRTVILKHGKGKAVPLGATQALRRRTDTDLHIHNPGRSTPGKENQHPFYRRLGGPWVSLDGPAKSRRHRGPIPVPSSP